MLDQSFSFKNFRIILDVVNRKGIYIEDKDFFMSSDIFKDSRDKSIEIVDTNKKIRNEYNRVKVKKNKTQADYQKYNELKEEKKVKKTEREVLLENALLKLSKKANQKDYEIKIKKGQIKFGSQLYTTENKPEHFFVLKQLQRNIYKTFKVKQSERRSIISQLKLLLDDKFPKILIRTDIKKFYESIPHDKLLSKIYGNSLLSYPSKKIIKDILNQYWNIQVSDGIKNDSDNRVGIPRGIGISAYLSELYMRDFDKKIASTPNVTYYARYVDDIIIIITPNNRDELKKTRAYLNEIKSIVAQSINLEVNSDKTFAIDLRKRHSERKTSKKYEFTYLGYKFVIRYKKEKDDKSKDVIKLEPLEMLMSEDKVLKYKQKIDLAFDDFQQKKIQYVGKENKTNRLLIRRIKFLANNSQLVRRKSNVFVGIFFSNEYLTPPYPNLIELDTHLKDQIDTLENTIGNTVLIQKLKALSFIDGFANKKFIRFNPKAFQNGKTLGIWKNI